MIQLKDQHQMLLDAPQVMPLYGKWFVLKQFRRQSIIMLQIDVSLRIQRVIFFQHHGLIFAQIGIGS